MWRLSPWEFHLAAILSEYLGDSSRCLTRVQARIRSLPAGARLLCGHPLCTGFWQRSQPARVVFDVLWIPPATKRSVTCANWETVKWPSRLYSVTRPLRSIVDGVFTESLLKVAFPAPSVAPLFKNLRHCLLWQRSLCAMPLALITTTFAQADSHLLGTGHLMGINLHAQILRNWDSFSALTHHRKSSPPCETFIGNLYRISPPL